MNISTKAKRGIAVGATVLAIAGTAFWGGTAVNAAGEEPDCRAGAMDATGAFDIHCVVPIPMPTTVTVTTPVPVPTTVTSTVTQTVTTTPTQTTPAPTTPAPTTPTPTGSPSPTSTPGNWPNAFTTGPNADCSTLRRMDNVTLSQPGQVLEGADVHGTITVTAANVTIRNSCIRPDSARDFGIVIRWVRGTVVDHVLIVGAGRVHQGIQAYDDSGVTVRYTEVSGTDDAISTGVGLIEENYLHSPRQGGHADMVEATGYRSSWSQSGLTIRHNTILNSLSQTSAIALFQDTGQAFRNATITNNLLAGGAYTIYGGAGPYGTGSNIVITNNVFQSCGSAGCVTAFSASGPGNLWANNTNTSGVPINP